jgi:methanogenic corrinoid protein MtbC1
VSESSVKRWCNSGAIPTVRTFGGHRRIPVSGFLQFVQDSNLEAHMGGRATGGVAETPSRTETLDDQQRRFVSALEIGNESECRELLQSFYARNRSFAQVADLFIASAFRRLGERWNCGEVEIYQERRGCEICGRLINDFLKLIPEAPANAPLALGGTPSGDNYSLPTRLIDLVLRECSWRTMNLGSNLPLTTIAAAVNEHQPRLVWLSVSHLPQPDQFADEFAQFRASVPDDLMIVIGGRALTDDLRPKLSYTAHCDNMQQFAAFATALHGKRQAIQTTRN